MGSEGKNFLSLRVIAYEKKLRFFVFEGNSEPFDEIFGDRKFGRIIVCRIRVEFLGARVENHVFSSIRVQSREFSVGVESPIFTVFDVLKSFLDRLTSCLVIESSIT